MCEKCEHVNVRHVIGLKKAGSLEILMQAEEIFSHSCINCLVLEKEKSGLCFENKKKSFPVWGILRQQIFERALAVARGSYWPNTQVMLSETCTHIRQPFLLWRTVEYSRDGLSKDSYMRLWLHFLALHRRLKLHQVSLDSHQQ